MAIREHAEGKRDLLLIDPRKLNVDPDYNVRKLDSPEAREGLDELKALIRASGVQEALRVREDTDGKLIIVRGHRRHKVVMELINDEAHDIKLIPVTQEPRGTTPADRTQLAQAIEESEQVTPENWKQWRQTWEDRYGATISVPKFTADTHEQIDPLSELAEKVHPDKIIVVETAGAKK